MEENLDKLFDYRALIPGSGRFASIVGIGGGACRVVDQMRKGCLPDVQLYAFGMNRKEMDELSLCGKYLIGQEVHIPEHTRSLSGSLLGYKTIP